MSVNQKGHSKMPVANPGKATGGQGNGGALKGKKVAAVNNPRGIEPQKLGGGMGSPVQGPVQPKVGK